LPGAAPSDAPLSLALLLAALIGLSLGLLGGGGSTLAVPVLVYVAGLDARTAVGASLAVVGATSFVAAIAQARQGRVRARAAALFAAAGMPAAWAGSHLTALVPSRVLLLAFGALMVVVAAVMLRGAEPGERDPRRGPPARAPAVLAAGGAVGLLTGFLGIGGGFLIVPALVLLVHLPMHQAVGTSLAVIAANAAAGLSGHARVGLPLGLVTSFSAVAIGGALMGTRFGAHVPARRLERAFALVVLAVGAGVFVHNLSP